MCITVRYENGTTADAVVLAAGSDRIRVIVAGGRTTEEWLVVDGRLVDEKGRRVELETMVGVPGIGYPQARTERAMTA
jgi:hypothetical protein